MNGKQGSLDCRSRRNRRSGRGRGFEADHDAVAESRQTCPGIDAVADGQTVRRSPGTTAMEPSLPCEVRLRFLRFRRQHRGQILHQRRGERGTTESLSGEGIDDDDGGIVPHHEVVSRQGRSKFRRTPEIAEGETDRSLAMEVHVDEFPAVQKPGVVPDPARKVPRAASCREASGRSVESLRTAASCISQSEPPSIAAADGASIERLVSDQNTAGPTREAGPLKKAGESWSPSGLREARSNRDNGTGSTGAAPAAEPGVSAPSSRGGRRTTGKRPCCPSRNRQTTSPFAALKMTDSSPTAIPSSPESSSPVEGMRFSGRETPGGTSRFDHSCFPDPSSSPRRSPDSASNNTIRPLDRAIHTPGVARPDILGLADPRAAEARRSK